MRPIKFRAWDIQRESMLDWNYLSDKQCTYLNSKHFHAMQFTGLLDKNGKEIYESDIVNYGPSRDFSVEWVVKYGCWYVVPCGDYENNAPLGKSEKACEIIGDIYRNPELLEEAA